MSFEEAAIMLWLRQNNRELVSIKTFDKGGNEVPCTFEIAKSIKQV